MSVLRIASPNLWAQMTYILAALAIVAPVARAFPVDPAQEGHGLPNFRVLNGRVGTCGQPSEEGFKRLAEQGYKTVLNLRTAAEGADQERSIVEKLGMKYVNIPVSQSAISEQAVDQFREVMRQDENERIVVHCASANRVGGMMMAYLVLDQKMTLADAEKKAEEIGFTGAPWLKTFLLAYIKSH